MYPEWWDRTLTIYSKHTEPNGFIEWYKYTVDNCFVKDAGNTVTIGTTLLETDDIICRIPKQHNFCNKGDWSTLTSNEKAYYFTVGAGDIIVFEYCDDEIDEYVKGKRSSDLLNKYKQLQGCMIVKRVMVNTGRGRNLEHYYIKGA